MFEILSKRLLNTKIKILENDKEEAKEIKKILGNGVKKIRKEHIDKLKEIRGKLDNGNEEDKKTIKLIDEVLELKDTKRHIAVDRLRAKNLETFTNYLKEAGITDPSEFIGKISKVNNLSEIDGIIEEINIEGDKKSEFKNKVKGYTAALIAAQKKDKYETSDDLNSFQGIPNSIQITDIHNDMYHFLLGMTEPITINGSTEPAFIIDNPSTIKEEVNGTKYEYPNLKYNKNFEGTITFGGDLIQSHDSGVDDNLGAIPLCLAMRNCMRQANYEIDEEIGEYKKLNPSIVYVAGNHELEALNEGQHPEVRTIMQGMFEKGLVEYCHYDEASDTLISHTKLNKPLVLKILRDL